MKNRKLKLSKKTLVFTATVFLIALGSLTLWALRDDSRNTASTTGENSKNNGSDISYAPPTKEERQAADDAKDKVIKEENSKPATVANVVIVDANQYESMVEVRAFISNALQSGTCTYQFSKGDVSFSIKTSAYKDATTTQCTSAEVDRSKFPSAGSWNVTVGYSGDSIRGEANRTFEVKP